MTKWIWGAAAVLAGVGVYFFATRPKPPGSPMDIQDLCLKDLPTPFKGQAADIVAKADVARMESFAVQCDARGWHCAARELRAAAVLATADAAERAKREKMDVTEVAEKADPLLGSQTKNVLALFVKPKVGEDYSRITFVRMITDADVGTIESLATSLERAGYALAHRQMLDAVGAARATVKAAAAERARCKAAIDALPTGGFLYSTPVISGRIDPVANVREWVQGILATGVKSFFDMAAEVLEGEAKGAPSGSLHTKIFHDAAVCLSSSTSSAPAPTGLIFPLEGA